MAQNRRWIPIKWNNVSIDEVFSWLQYNISTIEIESIVVNARYGYKGILFPTMYWYFESFSLRYYPDSPGHSYGYLWCSNKDGFFRSGKTKCYNYVNQYINNPKRIITDYYKSAHYQGGGDSLIHFVFTLWENA